MFSNSLQFTVVTFKFLETQGLNNTKMIFINSWTPKVFFLNFSMQLRNEYKNQSKNIHDLVENWALHSKFMIKVWDYLRKIFKDLEKNEWNLILKLVFFCLKRPSKQP